MLKTRLRQAGNLWAVVMAGGAGTRFWPESRQATPKQFVNLFGPKTLFEETLDRIAPLIPKSRVLVVTQKKYAQTVARLAKIPSAQILGEPVGRNTAPCVALAAKIILRKDPNAVMAILPSDHKIGKPKEFVKLLASAGRAAYESSMPVTFGIRPTFAHTGYGYLEKGEAFREVPESLRQKIYQLKEFHEKPDLPKAKKFLATGNFFWNSGIFIWRASALEDAVNKYLPAAEKILNKIVTPQGGFRETQFQKCYAQMPNVSIDYGLMEKMKGKILTLPADINWSDLGGWLALENLWKRDGQGNLIKGDPVLAVDSRNNIIKTKGQLVALLGVENLVVVSSGDALLICPKEKSEAIRQIVTALQDRKLNRYL